MRRIRRIILNSAGTLAAAAVIVVAMLWLSGTFRKNRIEPEKLAADRPTTLPATLLVSYTQSPQYAELVGSVQAQQRSAVTARITANILKINVVAGDPVDVDQPLVELYDRDLKARVGQADEALRAAEARSEQAKKVLESQQQAAKSGATSQIDLVRAQAGYNEALADVQRAKESINEANVGLGNATLRSPIKGVVIDRQAEPGDQATPGKSILVVYDPKHLRLEVSVRESLAGRLKPGMPIPVDIDAINKERAGIVREIVPAADPLSHSFLVKVDIVDPSDLLPGMFGKIRLPLGSEKRIEVPLAAVQHVGQLDLVTAVVDGRPERRAVRLGHVGEKSAEILAGLEEGERIAVP